MTNEELFNSALNVCDELLNIKYEVIIGKKGKTVYLNLPFKKSQFPHLLGIHKLEDIKDIYNNVSKERIFENLIYNKNNIKPLIIKSKHFYKIIDRLDALLKLESILDHNLETYYSKNRFYQRMSSIDYDYIFDYCIKNRYYAFYFIKNSYSKYMMVSLFENYLSNVLHANRPFTLLFKAKDIYNKSTNKIILFKR